MRTFEEIKDTIETGLGRHICDQDQKRTARQCVLRRDLPDGHLHQGRTDHLHRPERGT